MWIDKKKQVEIEQQRELYPRAVKAIGVLFIGVLIAYIFTEWLYSSGTLSNEFFYNQLAIPSIVNPTTIRIMVVALMVNSAQLMIIIGMALLNTENRKRPGIVTAPTQRSDFYDRQIGG